MMVPNKHGWGGVKSYIRYNREFTMMYCNIFSEYKYKLEVNTSWLTCLKMKGSRSLLNMILTLIIYGFIKKIVINVAVQKKAQLGVKKLPEKQACRHVIWDPRVYQF